MKLEAAHRRILEYLRSHGPANTYRLSAILKADRLKLISIIEEMAKEGLTEFSSNIARVSMASAREEQIKGKDKAKAYPALKLSDASPGKEFHFCNGIHAKNLDELSAALKNIDDTAYQYHANNEKNDFSSWINDVIGDKELADSLKMKNKEESIKILGERINYLKSQIGRENAD